MASSASLRTAQKDLATLARFSPAGAGLAGVSRGSWRLAPIVILPSKIAKLKLRRLVAPALLAATQACAPAKAPSAHGEALAPASGQTRTAVPTAPEICGNAFDDNGNGLADEGCGLPTGLAQFLAAWEEPKADVDLRVLDPNGELVEVGRPTKSGLVKDRDCPGRKSDCGGHNLEVVYLEQGKLLRGDYRVRVRLVSLGGAEPPVSVHFAARVGYRSYGSSFELTRPEGEWTTVIRL